MDRKSLMRIDFRNLHSWDQPVETSLDDSFFESLDQEEIMGGKVQAVLSLRTLSGDNYSLRIKVSGNVVTQCDRCLEAVTLPIEAEDEVLLTFNTECDNLDAVILPEREPYFDAAWTVYEIIATSLPTERKHPEGECAADMIGRISGQSDSLGGEPED